MLKGKTGRGQSDPALSRCWPVVRVVRRQRPGAHCSRGSPEPVSDSGSRGCVPQHALCVLAVVLGAPAGRAQLSPPGYAAEVRHEAESRADSALRSRWNAAYEARRARAHARLGASASSVEPQAFCPAIARSKASASGFDAADKKGKLAVRQFVPRSAARPATVGWRGIAAPGESAGGLFGNFISGQVVQARCINCHVDGGVSGHTRLVLSPSTAEGHEALNLAVFENFLASVEDGDDLILNKIRGVAHGGGIQVPAGSADFANMERFLRLLGGGSSASGLSPETLFDGVTMASPAKTLRRAALIFAGRLPTQAELSAVGDGQISSLRRTIRRLMTGAGFHEFLLRGSNDRLLTDRGLMGVTLDLAFVSHFVELLNIHWEMAMAARRRGHEEPWDDPAFRIWSHSMNFGLTRAPLELIAHVVENDLPYTEILTADYIMANPFSAKAYGARTRFNDDTDAREFRESKIQSYYRTDDSKILDEYSDGQRVVNPGNLKTDFPHAGILNTNPFFLRYPTTATNRNRARSRWTYYHFLAKDIEKSASRTTDPVALADTDNPTLKNPACTVCHVILDPVAGSTLCM